MKYRITSLIVFFSLVLSACSLAEDITPPPGYQYPTAISSQTSIASTVMSATTVEPTNVQENTPEATQSTSSTLVAGSTPVASLGSISGSLVNGSGSSIADGQKVTLEGFDVDSTGNYQKIVEVEAPVNPDGTYGFTDVEFIPNRAFLVITSWQGVEYPSDPIFITDTTSNFTIPITIYDKTNDLNNLKLNQIHVSFGLTSPTVMQVTELFILSNSSQQAVFVPSDGTSIPFIQLPVTAGSTQFQLAQGSAQLMNATDGFALLPGADKQYAFLASFSMAYGSSLDFEQPFSLPVSSLTTFVPSGMRLRSDQLTPAGSQDLQGQTYSMYQANNLAAGSSISLTISGQPGGATGTNKNEKNLVLTGIGIVGILLVGVGIFLYIRDRRRLLKLALQVTPEMNVIDSLGEDRDNIMDAMIVLDDQYKAGAIPKEAYEKRRSELKDRFKELL